MSLSRRPQPIFTKSLSKEASEQTIEVLDDDPKKFELMLKFIYTMDLPFPSRSSSCYIEALVEHNIMVPIGVHILADKYEITPLLHRTCDQVAVAMRIHGKSLEADHIAAIVAAYSITNSFAKLAGSCCSFSFFEMKKSLFERSTKINDFAL